VFFKAWRNPVARVHPVAKTHAFLTSISVVENNFGYRRSVFIREHGAMQQVNAFPFSANPDAYFGRKKLARPARFNASDSNA
jgi:hypothetical protein